MYTYIHNIAMAILNHHITEFRVAPSGALPKPYNGTLLLAWLCNVHLTYDVC